jgi:N-acetylmuramic acid 6-phosphate etherase
MSTTETVNPDWVNIDSWPTEQAVAAMLDGQAQAIAAIQSQVPAIARAAEAAADRLRVGQGRLLYAGAGTSGRVAVQDGVELWPTFGWPEDRLGYVVAGGLDALMKAVEGAEDDRDAAIAQVEVLAVTASDVFVGVAASGRTPFTMAALETARAKGALTIAIANNAEAPLAKAADHGIIAVTGSEAIAGSTRMKAGTAQKAILNLLSTAIMLRLGRVYNGLMVDMIISNDKLLKRGQDMVREITGCSDRVAANALDAANRDIKKAVLIVRGMSADDAAALLARHSQILRAALDEVMDEARAEVS